MMVIRTHSGMAMAVAVALDKMNFPEILGTVAGDDCVICVVKSKQNAASLTEKLKP
jgi:transcriptional regulator of arginine metabolism